MSWSPSTSNPMALNEDSKIPFGKHRGAPLKNCPDSYLKWISENLDGDWATAAAKTRAWLRQESGTSDSLERQADEL